MRYLLIVTRFACSLCFLLTCHTPMSAAGGEKGLRKSLQIL